ncbi:MAG: hypothetical protein R3C56_10195 [Pirellulaceae bacterium]
MQSLQTALAASATGNQVSLQLVDQDGNPLATSGVLGTSQITVNDRNNTLIISALLSENLDLIEQQSNGYSRYGRQNQNLPN